LGSTFAMVGFISTQLH